MLVIAGKVQSRFYVRICIFNSNKISPKLEKKRTISNIRTLNEIYEMFIDFHVVQCGVLAGFKNSLCPRGYFPHSRDDLMIE